jgi:hypothetical protein
MMEKYPGIDPYINPREIRKTLNTWKSKGATLEVETPGRTIHADIKPSPDKFLDWDKPLSEQGEGVRKALESHPALKEIIADRESVVGKLSNKNSVFAKMWEGGGRGAGVYQTLSQKLGSEKAASELLHDLGIPGIRYLDQGSRGAGKGTYNYVVFSDKDVSILK